MSARDFSLHFPDPVYSLNAAVRNRQHPAPPPSSPAAVSPGLHASPCTSSMSPTPTPSPRIPCAPPEPVPCALINQQTLNPGTLATTDRRQLWTRVVPTTSTIHQPTFMAGAPAHPLQGAAPRPEFGGRPVRIPPQSAPAERTPEMFVKTPSLALWGPCGSTAGRQQDLGVLAQQSVTFLLHSPRICHSVS